MLKSLLNRASMQTRMILVGVVLPGLIIALLFYLYVGQSRDRSVQSCVDTARAVCLSAESAREQTQGQWDTGIFSHTQLKEWEDAGESEKVLSAVPVVTAWNTAMGRAKEGGYEFNVPALEPRNPDNAANELQTNALQAIRNEKLSEYHVVNEETNCVHYFRPVHLTESCLVCHGHPSRSEELWGNSDGVDVTGHKMENWSAGQIHGAFEVVQSLDAADEAAAASILSGGILAVVSLVIAGIATVLTLRSLTSRISKSARAISGATQELSSVSVELDRGARETSDESTAMASAATQMAANMNTVAAAVEEMGASVSEIASSASKATEVTNDAVHEADATNEVICRLGESSNRIGEVLKVIDSLAEQTNLLALNATIEAARAGEAGRGFAVVANEVKELANQTGTATQNIAGVVEGIQNDTVSAVSSVRKIHEIIAEIDNAQQAIASAVEEQNATTTEIARNVQEVATASHDITQGVASVSNNTTATVEQIESSRKSVTDIDQMAEDLQKMLGQMASES